MSKKKITIRNKTKTLFHSPERNLTESEIRIQKSFFNGNWRFFFDFSLNCQLWFKILFEYNRFVYQWSAISFLSVSPFHYSYNIHYSYNKNVDTILNYLNYIILITVFFKHFEILTKADVSKFGYRVKLFVLLWKMRGH